jgi:hypothetical protein
MIFKNKTKILAFRLSRWPCYSSHALFLIYKEFMSRHSILAPSFFPPPTFQRRFTHSFSHNHEYSDSALFLLALSQHLPRLPLRRSILPRTTRHLSPRLLPTQRNPRSLVRSYLGFLAHFTCSPPPTMQDRSRTFRNIRPSRSNRPQQSRLSGRYKYEKRLLCSQVRQKHLLQESPNVRRILSFSPPN